MKKRVIIWFLMVFGTILGGFLLINFAYSINTENMIDNLIESKNIFEKEGAYTRIDDSNTSTLDNFSDSLMLLTAGYNGEESVVDKAMNNYRYNLSGRNPCGTYNIIDFRNPEGSEDAEVASYARYWHGYLIFLKPLLTMFDYSQIRILNMVMQILLLITIVFLMIKRKIGIYAIPLLSTFTLMNPIAIFNSMHYSSVWYIVYMSIITYLVFKDFIVEKKLHYLLFTIVGMLTSYFDLLTCPIITLGIPLIITIIAEDLEFKDAIKRVLSCGTLWCIGYVVMFASKWIIATIILNKNVIADALNTVESRSSNIVSGNVEILRMNGIYKTFEKYDYNFIKNIFIFNIIIIAIFNIFKLRFKNIVEKFKKDINEKTVDETLNKEQKMQENKKTDNKNSYKTKKYTDRKKMMLSSIIKNLPILGVACMPFVWFFAIANHTQIHAAFTFRTASIFWFGVLTFMYVLSKEVLNKKNNI